MILPGLLLNKPAQQREQVEALQGVLPGQGLSLHHVQGGQNSWPDPQRPQLMGAKVAVSNLLPV